VSARFSSLILQRVPSIFHPHLSQLAESQLQRALEDEPNADTRELMRKVMAGEALEF